VQSTYILIIGKDLGRLSSTVMVLKIIGWVLMGVEVCGGT
jgi:hypothetical protein